MRNSSTWLRAHRLITIFILFIGLAVGIHLVANWRAEARWQHYRAAAQARGIKLTLAEFAPPEIPDADNFAALPMFRAIFVAGATDPMKLPDVRGGIPGFGVPQEGKYFDAQKWQTYFKDTGFLTEITDSPPRDVLQALEHYAPQFKEWSEWKTRKRCAFPLDLKAGAAMPLPHLGMFLQASKLFSLRLRCHLLTGDSSAAYADFREGLQACHALTNEPTLISGLIQLASTKILLAAIGDGLAAHTWAEPELKKLGDDLSSIRVCDDYLRSFSSERGFGNLQEDAFADMSPIQRYKKRSALSAGYAALGMPNDPPDWVFLFIPKWLCRNNQLRYNLYMDEKCTRVDTDELHFTSDVCTPTNAERLEGLDKYHFFLFNQSLPMFSQVTERFVQVQTLLDQTRQAIALERFRLAHGTYPEALSELVPDFLIALPIDVYTSRSMTYRRQEGGTFLLYGVSKNRKDDGGTIDLKRGEREHADDVWLYAPTAG